MRKFNFQKFQTINYGIGVFIQKDEFTINFSIRLWDWVFRVMFIPKGHFDRSPGVGE